MHLGSTFRLFVLVESRGRGKSYEGACIHQRYSGDDGSIFIYDGVVMRDVDRGDELSTAIAGTSR